MANGERRKREEMGEGYASVVSGQLSVCCRRWAMAGFGPGWLPGRARGVGKSVDETDWSCGCQERNGTQKARRCSPRFLNPFAPPGPEVIEEARPRRPGPTTRAHAPNHPQPGPYRTERPALTACGVTVTAKYNRVSAGNQDVKVVADAGAGYQRVQSRWR
jgi:hypothetical protein